MPSNNKYVEPNAKEAMKQFKMETAREVDRVIAAYREGKPLGGEVRRMVK